MEIVYIDHLFYPVECATLFARKLNEGLFRSHEGLMPMPVDCLKELRSNYDLPLHDLTPIFEQLTELINYVWDHMTVPKDKLTLYFKQNLYRGISIGAMIASLMRVGVNLSQLSEKERCFYLYIILSQYAKKDTFLEDDETPPECELDLFDYIDQMDTEPESKWEALRFYHHWKEYEHDVHAILAEAEVLFRDREAPLLELAQTAIQRVKSALGTQGVDALRDRYHIKPESNRIIISPSVFLFQSIGVHIIEQPSKQAADAVPHYENCYMWIGILVDTVIEISNGHVSSLEQLSTRMKLLSDKRRLEILKALRRKPLCGQELAELTGLTAATISHHMSALTSEGFVNIDKLGTKVYYMVADETINQFLTSLQKLLLQ